MITLLSVDHINGILSWWKMLLSVFRNICALFSATYRLLLGLSRLMLLLTWRPFFIDAWLYNVKLSAVCDKHLATISLLSRQRCHCTLHVHFVLSIFTHLITRCQWFFTMVPACNLCLWENRNATAVLLKSRVCLPFFLWWK